MGDAVEEGDRISENVCYHAVDGRNSTVYTTSGQVATPQPPLAAARFPQLTPESPETWSRTRQARRTKQSSLNSSNVSGVEGAKENRDQFAHIAEAHSQHIADPVRVPRCVLAGKQHIERLLRHASSDRLHLNQRDALEVSAITDTTPPVTKESLKELELPAIQNNLSLRNDLCFDHELFFQRISGSKGEEKQWKASIFYQCLAVELLAYAHQLQGHCGRRWHSQEHYSVPPRLPAFFRALRDLLEMLVPDADKQDVLERIDVEHLVRMVRIGQFDASKFSTWLCQLLMTHCAPMRDELAREMHKKISSGAENNDIDLLVDGLETLMSLLENMKLDVANHQVRSFKLLLIADTVPFLKDCFSKLLESGQLDLSSAKRWFDRIRSRDSHSRSSDFDCFLRGLVEICSLPLAQPPQTFAYDKERLQSLQNDFVDCAQLHICSNTFIELTLKWSGRAPSNAEIEEVNHRVLQLTTNEEGEYEGPNRHLEEVALELGRAATGASQDITSRHNFHFDAQYAIDLLQARFQEQHGEIMSQMSQQLLQRTRAHSAAFGRLNTLQISNLQRTWVINRSSKGFPLPPDIEDISRRLAHVAVIHWEVWSGLVYLDS